MYSNHGQDYFLEGYQFEESELEMLCNDMLFTKNPLRIIFNVLAFVNSVWVASQSLCKPNRVEKVNQFISTSWSK